MVSNNFSAVSRYGSASPGPAVTYSNGNLTNDIIPLFGSSLQLRLRMDCPGLADCGALIDKVELVIEYGDEDPPPPTPPPTAAKSSSTPSIDAQNAYWTSPSTTLLPGRSPATAS